MGNDSKLRVKCSISNCRADEEQRRSGYWGGRQSDEDGRNEYCAKEGERKKKVVGCARQEPTQRVTHKRDPPEAMGGGRSREREEHAECDWGPEIE